jgi:glycosyltransferase involved in cell wall biosynthesis
MTERISVIIPAHNEEEYIGRCLESVRAAARKLPTPVEAVVVLNRCTDRTEAISLEYGATIVHEDARNLSRIRNAGIRASTGSVTITIDADSWMSANMLAEVSRRLVSRILTGRDREAADHFYYSPRQTKQGQPNNSPNRTVVPRERGPTSG